LFAVVFVIFKRQQGGKRGQQRSGQEKREFLVASWERGETHLHQFGLAELPFAPFAPFAEFGVVPFDAAAGGASFAAGPPSGLAIAALAESMAALAFVCSKSVCLWWVAERAERFSRSSPALSYFVRLLVGGEQERVCARASAQASVRHGKGVSLLFSLSRLSTLTSLGSARPETLAPFPLNPAALREAKAGFSLTQLTSPSARPPPNHCPTRKKK